jgi:hypothetical protein
MRRLAWIPTLIAMPAVVLACAQPNPAFDGIDEDTGDTTLTQGDGDGDTNSGSGDSFDTSDSSDMGDGDGDGDDGPTAPDTGDGDGDGDGLPACPESLEVAIPVVQDTFLDATQSDGSSCVIDWNYEGNMPALSEGTACPGLAFGGVPMHWACGNNQGFACTSTWLGQFAVGAWEQQAPVVMDAHFQVTAKIMNAEPALVSMYELDVASTEYAACGKWKAGDGYGSHPEPCVTTALYAAEPHPWSNEAADGLLPFANQAIAATNAPVSPEPDFHDLILPVDTVLVQGWLRGEIPHPGVLLSSSAWAPREFNLLAAESNSPPLLIVKLCTDAP